MAEGREEGHRVKKVKGSHTKNKPHRQTTLLYRGGGRQKRKDKGGINSVERNMTLVVNIPHNTQVMYYRALHLKPISFY